MKCRVHPEKKQYRTLKVANAMLLLRLSETNGLRPYLCPDCKQYHLTSSPLREESLTKEKSNRKGI